MTKKTKQNKTKKQKQTKTKNRKQKQKQNKTKQKKPAAVYWQQWFQWNKRNGSYPYSEKF